MMEALAAMGILTTFTVTAGLLAIKLAEGIIERSELEEEDNFVYDKDSNKIIFNEEDQE